MGYPAASLQAQLTSCISLSEQHFLHSCIVHSFPSTPTHAALQTGGPSPVTNMSVVVVHSLEEVMNKHMQLNQELPTTKLMLLKL